MMWVKTLLGDSLVCTPNTNRQEKNSDGTVTVDKAIGTSKYIALYFSAKWCGPCKFFTPILAKAYNGPLQQSCVQVIFVSSDRSQVEFDEYHGHMPWPAIPFGHPAIDRAKNLCKTQGIPQLALLNAFTGEVLANDVRADLQRDNSCEQFPWGHSVIMAELQKAGPLIRHGERTPSQPASILQGRELLVYFSASWCGPCKAFTPTLCTIFQKICRQHPRAMLVFVSLDKNIKSFENYFYNHFTKGTLAISYDNEKTRKRLREVLQVRGIPSLVTIGHHGRVVQANARQHCLADPKGTLFPWPSRACNDISTAGTTINTSLCAVLILPSHRQLIEDEFLEVASQYSPETGGSASMLFYTSIFRPVGESIVADVVRRAVRAGPRMVTLVILDVPGGGFYSSSTDIEYPGDIAKFFTLYYSGRTERLKMDL